nr:hypothetical protein [Tanacetum cinerariifolium]
QGEACPTNFDFEANQDRATIAKTSTLPYDSTPKVTSPATAEGREAAVERVSDDTEEMAIVLTSMDAATVLASKVAKVPTGSGSIPTAGPPTAEVPTGSDVVPTDGLIFATAIVVTPYTRRNIKETMVESETPKKKKIQEKMDIQMARQLEEEMERDVIYVKSYIIFLSKLSQIQSFIQNEESFENSSKKIAISNPNQEKEELPQDSDIRQLIRKECCVEASDEQKRIQEPPQDYDICQLIREECCVEASEEQKQSMEDTMLKLVKIYQEKEFLCIHDDVDDLIESALNSKLLLINSNSQRLDKKEQEVKNVVEQPAKRGNRNIQSLQNFKVVHKKPEHLLSMGYEHLSITLETESNEVTESNAEKILPIPSKYEVTLEDEIECDMPAKDVCSPVFTTFLNPLFKYNDDLDSSNNESLPDEDVPAEEFKIYSNALFDEDEINSDKLDPHSFNVESDFVESLLNHDTFIDFSSKFDFSGELAHIKPEILKSNFDFKEEIRFIENFLYDNSSLRPPEELNAEIADTIIESIPSLPILVWDGDSQREEIDIVTETNDVRRYPFLEELLIDDSILSHESSDFNFEDNPSIPRPPPKPPDVETDAGEEIPVVMTDKDEDVYSSFIFVIFAKMFSLLSAESEDTIFDPVIEAFLCGILVRFLRSSHPLIDSSLEKSISFDQYCLAVIFPPLCSNSKH